MLTRTVSGAGYFSAVTVTSTLMMSPVILSVAIANGRVCPSRIVRVLFIVKVRNAIGSVSRNCVGLEPSFVKTDVSWTLTYIENPPSSR